MTTTPRDVTLSNSVVAENPVKLYNDRPGALRGFRRWLTSGADLILVGDVIEPHARCSLTHIEPPSPCTA